MTAVLEKLRDEMSTLNIELPLSRELLDIAAYRFVYDMDFGNSPSLGLDDAI